VAPGALEQAWTTQAMAPGALEQVFTAQAGAGLLAIELKSGKLVHQSPSFEALASWIPVEARGNIQVSLEARDGGDFHRFCQSVVRDAGEPYGETFLDRDKVVGRSITVRFFTRAPGPPGLQNPEWLLMVRAVKLTLVGVQPRQLAGELPAAGRRLPFFGQARIPDAIGVFTADLSGGTPQQWTLQVAHVRYLLDMEVASGTYTTLPRTAPRRNTDTGNQNPLEQIAMLFEFSHEEGGGASVFSRAAAHLGYAATSALNIAQRSASWLTRKALQTAYQWSVRLHDDDTVSMASTLFITLLGGLSTSIEQEHSSGKIKFSYGGLDIMHFVADPEKPLDGNLRATFIRIASAKTEGEFDVQHPYVVSCMWGSGNFQIYCKTLSIDKVGKKMGKKMASEDSVGKKMASEEDVSQLLEKLKISPGGGPLSDGTVTICIGTSDVQPDSPHNRQPSVARACG